MRSDRARLPSNAMAHGEVRSRDIVVVLVRRRNSSLIFSSFCFIFKILSNLRAECYFDLTECMPISIDVRGRRVAHG